jgi:hypothetical protein
MLESQQGRELYAAHATLPATGPGLVVKREDDAIAKAETTERDTERYAAATGLDLATARRHVADYYRQ